MAVFSLTPEDEYAGDRSRTGKSSRMLAFKARQVTYPVCSDSVNGATTTVPNHKRRREDSNLRPHTGRLCSRQARFALPNVGTTSYENKGAGRIRTGVILLCRQVRSTALSPRQSDQVSDVFNRELCILP